MRRMASVAADEAASSGPSYRGPRNSQELELSHDSYAINHGSPSKVKLLLYCSQISSKRSFEEMAEQAVGRIGKQIIELCTAALNLGAIVAYLNILADILSSVAGTIIPPGAEPSRSVYIAGVTLFGAFPVAMIVRDHSIVAAFSTASVGFIFLFAFVIVIFALSAAVEMAGGTSSASSGVQLWQPDGLLVAFPVMAYGFTAHPYYLGIYSNMHTGNVARMTKVTDIAMGLAAGLYWLVGMAGYITFKSRTAGDLLRNFGAAHVMGLRGVYERSIKLCYGLSILGSVPLVILPFYNLLLPVLGYDKSSEDVRGGKHHISDSDDEGMHVGGKRAAVERHPSRSSHYPDGSGPGPGRAHSTDVVDIKLQHDGIHLDHNADFGDFLVNPGQHATVSFLVLGLAMASAIWVPNVEFIFGLTGATASVLLAYILPAVVFIRLLDGAPELTGASKGAMVPLEVQRAWVWRRRKAIVLLVVGVVSGVMCTDAIVSAVKEEAAVVQLAQQLVAHEAVMAETNRAQQKAKEVVAAVSVVTTASQQLDQVQANASSTLGQLQEAAKALSSIAGHNNNRSSKRHTWDLNEVIKEHKQHAKESKVLKSVEATLEQVHAGMRRTADSVASIVHQLDATIAQVKEESSSRQQQANANAVTAAVDAAGSAADSGAAGGDSGAASAGSGAGTGDKDIGGSQGERATDLALELGKALGMYGKAAQSNVTAGKGLEAVRANAAGALTALNQSIAVLDNVTLAVKAAKRDHKHDQQVKEAAVHAMQAALNATATSALAMHVTIEALERSADDETDDLLKLLTQVASELQRTKSSMWLRKDDEHEEGEAQTIILPDGTSEVVDMGKGRKAAPEPAKAAVAAAAAATTPPGDAAAATVPGPLPQRDQTAAGAAEPGAGAIAGPADSATTAWKRADSAVAGSQLPASSSGSSNKSQEPANTSKRDDDAAAPAGANVAAADPAAAAAGAAVGPAANSTKSERAKERLDAMKKVIEGLQELTKGSSKGNSSESSSSSGGGGGSSSSSSNTVTKLPLAAAADAGAADSNVTSSRSSSQSATGATAPVGQHSTPNTSLHTTSPAAAAATIAADPSSTHSNSNNVTGSTGSSNTPGNATANDLKGVAEVLKDAVAWSEDSKAAAMKDIQDKLGKANSKVQERVVDILKDIKEAREKEKSPKPQHTAGSLTMDTFSAVQLKQKQQQDRKDAGARVAPENSATGSGQSSLQPGNATSSATSGHAPSGESQPKAGDAPSIGNSTDGGSVAAGAAAIGQGGVGMHGIDGIREGSVATQDSEKKLDTLNRRFGVGT